MAIPNGSGGYQVGAGNLNEALTKAVPVPATATVTATLTPAQVLNGLLLGSPDTTAATYTLPTVADLEAALPNSDKPGVSFDFSVMNVNGSSTGVITLSAGTGWSTVGLMTVVATAGTSQIFRARKSATGAWVLYRIG
jgi:hypothetical protein